MRAAYEKYQDQGFEVLSVSVQEGEAEVAAFIERHGLEYQFLMDTTGVTSIGYNVSSTPTTYFIAPDGTIEDVIIGVVNQGWLEKNIKKFIAS